MIEASQEQGQVSGSNVKSETGARPDFPNLKPFNTSSAREAGLKGVKARLENKARAEQEAALEREQARQDKIQLQALLQERAKEKVEEQARVEAERMTPDETYRIQRLDRVRKQIRLVDKLFESETDPDRLSKLATASAKLAEQERLLAGRPTPGSNKPVAKRAEKEPEFEPE